MSVVEAGGTFDGPASYPKANTASFKTPELQNEFSRHVMTTDHRANNYCGLKEPAIAANDTKSLLRNHDVIITATLARPASGDDDANGRRLVLFAKR